MKAAHPYLLILAVLVCLQPSCGNHKHDDASCNGHAHGNEQVAQQEEGEHGHGHGQDTLPFTIFSQTHELFGEAEPLVAGQPSLYVLHVSRLSDNLPATDGQLEIAFLKLDASAPADGPVGATDSARPTANRQVVSTAQKPSRKGIFELTADSPAVPGRYRLLVTYSNSSGSTSWELDVEVHTERMPVHQPEPGPGAVSFTKEQQWNLPFRVELPKSMQVANSRHTRAVVQEDPSSNAILSAVAGGRIVWNASTRSMIPGREIKSGELLGHLTASPPPDHVSHIEGELALIQAQAAAIRTDIDRIASLEASGLLTAGDESRETAALRTAEAELRRAQQELKRETSLAQKGLASQKDIVEARSLVEKARAERSRAQQELTRIRSWSAGRYELAADRVRNEAELARLVAAQEALTARLAEVKAGGNRVFEVRSDRDGVLTVLNAPSGSLVEVGSPLATVRAKDSILVQIQVLRTDRTALENVQSVTLMRPGWSKGRTLESLNASLISNVPVFDPQTGLYALTYRLTEAAGLVTGEILDALVSHGETRQELAVPTTSVVEISTLPYVFVLVQGELFQRRRVETGPRIGDYTVIRSGLNANERVVSVGGFDIHVASLTSTLESHQH